MSSAFTPSKLKRQSASLVRMRLPVRARTMALEVGGPQGTGGAAGDSEPVPSTGPVSKAQSRHPPPPPTADPVGVADRPWPGWAGILGEVPESG